MWDLAEYIVMINKCYESSTMDMAVWKCYINDVLAFVLIYVRL